MLSNRHNFSLSIGNRSHWRWRWR